MNKKKKKHTVVRRLLSCFCAGLCVLSGMCGNAYGATILPEGFCLLAEVAPSIQLDLRYAGNDNFVGRPIAGYEAEIGIMTVAAAQALAAVQQDLQALGLSLVLYDAYRPQTAVDDFIAWTSDPLDTAMQTVYYPDIPKDKLFEQGYIAKRSGHSRGSTVDVGLLDTQGVPVDMGCSFDTFGDIAAHGAAGLTNAQRESRTLLLKTMQGHGFKSYRKEWWHYTLQEETFPETYFDFPITGELLQRETE